MCVSSIKVDSSPTYFKMYFWCRILIIAHQASKPDTSVFWNRQCQNDSVTTTCLLSRFFYISWHCFVTQWVLMYHCLVSLFFNSSGCWQLHQAAGDWSLRDSYNIQEHPVWLMQCLLSGWKRHMHKHEPQWHGTAGFWLWDLIFGCSGLPLNSAH